MSILLFVIIFLFSSYFRSFGLRVITIVSDSCNQSSSALFYVVFQSLYRSINAISNAVKSSCFFCFFETSTPSLGCKALYMVMSFLVLWSICLSCSLAHFKNGPEYFTSGDSPGIYPFYKVLSIVCFRVAFLFFFRYPFFLFFLSSSLV